MRRKFRSRSSLQTAFNNRKYITRRIRLTISTRPPIPRQLASLVGTLFVYLAINLLLSRSPFAVIGLSIFILLLVHIPRRCVSPLTYSYLRRRRACERRQFARSAYPGISFRPSLPRTADSHQRYIAVRAARLQPFIAIRRHVIC